VTDESPSRHKSTLGDANIRRSIQDIALSIDPIIKIEPEVEDGRQLLFFLALNRVALFGCGTEGDVRHFRRIEKARGFEHVVSAGPDLGDGWGWRLKFERQHGTAVQQEDVIVLRRRNQVMVRRGSQSLRTIK
jgi:hypothetical protein